MSPAEYRAHVKAWRKRERRHDARTAQITCLLSNVHREKGHPARTLEDFIGEDSDE